MTLPSSISWITCQLGAREHYAIPRALTKIGALHTLITDAWVPPDSPLNALDHPRLKPLQDRFHADLKEAAIAHYTQRLLALEIQLKLRQCQPWSSIMARNTWFQQQACRTLKQLSHCDGLRPAFGHRTILFAYSYAALDLLKFAKTQGWYTILGQIDPGLKETEIVRQAHQNHPHLAPVLEEPPSQYWTQWQTECELADQIMVNSAWSQDALISVGIPNHKLTIVPLAYEPNQPIEAFQRHYPERFTAERPLRVLFLGQVILRKGIASLIKAAHTLRNDPIEFSVVGPLGIDPPQLANIQWLGPMPRSGVSQQYRAADVFLFPTLSDGFGLTQLEAQTWRLPIITSRHCGDVVQHQRNGLVLPEVTGAAIVTALQQCLAQPQTLQAYAEAVIPRQFSLDQLSQHLQLLSHASF